MQENDSYEYAEPADIWGSLNKEFWEGLASKKWTERRDSLHKFKVHFDEPPANGSSEIFSMQFPGNGRFE